MNQKTAIAAIAVVVIVCAIGAYFAFQDDGGSENEHDGTRSITDLDGRTVTFDENVDKVFVDWAQGLVILMTLDEIDKQAVVASYMDEGDTFAWASIICPDFLNVPRDSAPYSNVEALLNYGPDIVFTIEKNSISKYESVGIPHCLCGVHRLREIPGVNNPDGRSHRR